MRVTFTAVICLLLCTSINQSSLCLAATIEGVFVSASTEDTTHFLRFYHDNVVLAAGIATIDPVQSWPSINQWFNTGDLDNAIFHFGTYSLDQGNLSFSVFSNSNPTQSIDYNGTANESNLALDIYSNINGYSSPNTSYNCLGVVPCSIIPEPSSLLLCSMLIYALLCQRHTTHSTF